MVEKILFSLEKCVKCNETKKMLSDQEDIKIVTYPHNLSEWTREQIEEAKTYDVFEDLKKTAPVLWVDGKKEVGFLRIKRWFKEYVKTMR